MHRARACRIPAQRDGNQGLNERPFRIGEAFSDAEGNLIDNILPGGGSIASVRNILTGG